MKKLICLCLVLCCFLCSCAGINNKTTTLQKSIEIPENGIVTSDVFSDLKDNNSVCVFNGQSNSINYKWVVFGNKINTVRDYNLKVEVTDETSESLTFSVFDDFDFSPKLSLYLNEEWKCDTISVTDNNSDTVSGTLTAEKNSILNISVSKAGTYIVKAQTIEDTSAGDTDKTESSSSQTTSSDKKGTDESNNKSDKKIYSDGKDTKQDKYKTDPVPEGKPLPVDKEDTPSKSEGTKTPPKQFHCTLSIECSSILNHIENLKEEKLDVLPSDGIILESTDIVFSEGESVYDVLNRICADLGIHMEASFTPIYNSYYVEGIGNLYEFDCGDLSGWMYSVNGWYPNYGCSRYALKDGDVIEFRYTCDLGYDIGGGYSTGDS